MRRLLMVFTILALTACTTPLHRAPGLPPERLEDLPEGLRSEVKFAGQRVNVLREGRVLELLSADELIISSYGRDEHVRLIGIDGPDPAEPLGPEAVRYAAGLLRGREVMLGYGEDEDRDAQNRLLVYLYLPDGTFFNGLMVRVGLARAVPGPFNHLRDEVLGRYQQRARAEQRGIWSPGQ